MNTRIHARIFMGLGDGSYGVKPVKFYTPLPIQDKADTKHDDLIDPEAQTQQTSHRAVTTQSQNEQNITHRRDQTRQRS